MTTITFETTCCHHRFTSVYNHGRVTIEEGYGPPGEARPFIVSPQFVVTEFLFCPGLACQRHCHSLIEARCISKVTT